MYKLGIGRVWWGCNFQIVLSHTVSDCYLTPSDNFVGYFTAGTSYIFDDSV